MQTEKQRERLVELLDNLPNGELVTKDVADYLMSNNVVVLPCKVGDKVFQIEKNCLDCPHYSDGGYSDFCECVLDDNKMMFEVDFDKECIYEIIETKFIYGMIGQFGKNVFLSREDAENALNEKMLEEKAK